MKYRKKPIIIEALRFTNENKMGCYNFVTSSNCYAEYDELMRPILRISTLEGDMIANIGDYIIKGVNGEFYPCKADIFEKSYDEVIE